MKYSATREGRGGDRHQRPGQHPPVLYPRPGGKRFCQGDTKSPCRMPIKKKRANFARFFSCYIRISRVYGPCSRMTSGPTTIVHLSSLFMHMPLPKALLGFFGSLMKAPAP